MGAHLTDGRTLLPGPLDPTAASSEWAWDRLILTSSDGTGQACMGFRKGYLAVHELCDGSDYWFGISHLLSGGRVAEFAQLSTAVACAIELHAVKGWDVVQPGAIALAMRAAVVPILEKFWASEQAGGR